MNRFLITYTALYAILTVLALIQDMRIDAPRWRLVLRTMGHAAGVSGLILLAKDVLTPALAATWRMVFPCLVAEALINAFWDVRVGFPRHLALASGAIEKREARVALWASIALGVLLSVPYFVFNYRIAWGLPG